MADDGIRAGAGDLDPEVAGKQVTQEAFAGGGPADIAGADDEDPELGRGIVSGGHAEQCAAVHVDGRRGARVGLSWCVVVCGGVVATGWSGAGNQSRESPPGGRDTVLASPMLSREAGS